MYKRSAENILAEALNISPAVLLSGARQVGKSTLSQVKAAQSIKRNTFKHIIELQQKSSRRVLGLVLYAGERVLSFGEVEHERYAVPLGVFV